MNSELGVAHDQVSNAPTRGASGICHQTMFAYAVSKSRIVQIVLVIPAAMQGVILTAVFVLQKL